MSLLLEVLIGSIGIFRKWPVITGLLLFSVVGMGWSYWEGRSSANERYKAQKAEAILKDAKENRKIVEETQADLEKLNNEISQVNKAEATEIDKIEKLTPHQCLNLNLSDLWL